MDPRPRPAHPVGPARRGRVVGGVAMLFAVLEAARGIRRGRRRSLVLGAFGPDTLPTTLPYLFIGLGVTSFLVSLGYAVAPSVACRGSRCSSASSPASRCVLVAERVGLAPAATELVPVVWLTVFASSAINLTIAWTVSGASFDATPGKATLPAPDERRDRGEFLGHARGRSGRRDHQRRVSGRRPGRAPRVWRPCCLRGSPVPGATGAGGRARHRS